MKKILKFIGKYKIFLLLSVLLANRFSNITIICADPVRRCH